MLDDERFKVISEINWCFERYEFDITRVYQETATGNLFYSRDEGCSCPYPFERITESDLIPIRTMSDWNSHVKGRGDSRSINSVNSARGKIRYRLKNGK